MSEPRRTRDPGLIAGDYGGRAWVVCPRCAGPARSTDDAAQRRFRLTCSRCARATEVPSFGRPQRIGDGTDGRFGLPLYLAMQVRGHRLWAYDLTHLDALAAWLGASLRERPIGGVHRNRTMMARLPPWMSAAAARPDVVRALAALRTCAVNEGFADAGS